MNDEVKVFVVEGLITGVKCDGCVFLEIGFTGKFYGVLFCTMGADGICFGIEFFFMRTNQLIVDVILNITEIVKYIDGVGGKVL